MTSERLSRLARLGGLVPDCALAACALMAAMLPPACRAAAPLNLAAANCAAYSAQVAQPNTDASFDPINTVMWLFGYAVAASGAHFMYGDALASFGFGLDAECQANPSEGLLEAVRKIKPDMRNPMDLSLLDCATFAQRHADSAHSDPDSARTIMMWLLGFAVGKAGGRIYDASAIDAFEPALMGECNRHPQQSLYTALAAVKYPASIHP